MAATGRELCLEKLSRRGLTWRAFEGGIVFLDYDREDDEVIREVHARGGGAVPSPYDFVTDAINETIEEAKRDGLPGPDPFPGLIGIKIS
jgi:hypothetical protein